MMQAAKPLARTAARALRTSRTQSNVADESTDAFESRSVNRLLRYLGALRPQPDDGAGCRGVWYPHAFEAHAHKQGRLLPRDFWTGHAPQPHFEKEQGHAFVVREGQSASRALDAFFAGPTVAECGGAIAAAQWRLVRDTLGMDKFDAVFGSAQQATSPMLRMRISGLVTAWEPLSYFVTWGPTAKARGAFDKAAARPGDLYYIQGVPWYGTKHPDGAGQGYNVLYAGDAPNGEPLFAGFDLPSVRTENELRAYLVEEYNQPRSLRAHAYIKHSAHPNAYSLAAAGLAEKLPHDPRYAGGFLAGTHRRIRFDRLIQASNASASDLADTVAETLASQLRDHVTARLGQAEVG